MSVRICQACGAGVPGEARFCPKCGKEVGVRVCNACGAQVPEDARFCPKCGKEVGVRVCNACGAEVPEGARFCPKCGKEAASPLPSPPTPSYHTPTPLTPPAPAAPSKRQQPSSLSKKAPAWITVLIIIVFAFVAIILIAVFNTDTPSNSGVPANVPLVTQPPVTQPPAEKTISATENDALWTKANTALAGFLGEGFKTFGKFEARPATQQELVTLSQSLNDFNRAVNAIKGVTPPPEQSIVHWAFLPIYQEMPACMAGIRDALLSGDVLKADLEWHKLALLLDELGGVTKILTP